MQIIRYFTVTILQVVLLTHSCENAEILVVLPTALRSHFNIFRAVINTLAEEHKITFFSVYQLDTMNENVTNRRVTNMYENANKVNIFSELLNLDPWQQSIYILQYTMNIYEPILAGKDISDLFTTTKKYDLFITVNMYSESLFKLSSLLQVPLIQLCPSMPFLWTNDAINNRNNLGYDLSTITPEASEFFTDRFTKFVKHAYVWFYYEWVYLPTLEETSRKYFPSETPTIKEIARNTEGLLVNYMSEMGYGRPVTSNVLEIGGLHCKPASALPADLEQFVSSSGERGVIYFSLGMTFTDVALAAQIKSAIQNVLQKLPQNILWKLESTPPHLASNIKISKWFPQQDILGHNKTKLFITQGGMLSIQEAAYHGVPVLVLPLISDQFTNGYLTEKKGYGKMIKLKSFNEDEFYHSIQELLNNPKYKENAKLVSSSIRDQPISTATKLQHWVNYIIQHRNSSTFQPVTKHLSHLQLMELDIILAIVVIIIFTIASAIITWFYLYKIVKLGFRTKMMSKHKSS